MLQQPFNMKKILLFAFVAAGWGACKNNNDPCAHEFDQTAMLTNIGNNVILPRYALLQDKITDLHLAVQAFVANPQQGALDTLRQMWQAAYLQWQRAAIFEFGPAENHSLRSSMGNFPVFTARVEEGVTTGVYNLDDPAYEYARGLPVFDYLLYGLDTNDNGILAKYTSDTYASQRRQYISDVAQKMDDKVTAMHGGWLEQGGNFISSFNTTTGVAEGKPVSLLVNQLNAHYELLKNQKIGVPVGAKTSYIVAPNKVETYYYRDFSLPLALEALDASLDAFLGVGELTGTDGQGLDDYLDATGAEQNNQPLATVIKNQYALAQSSLQALQPANLHDALSADLEAVKAAYAHLQNQVVYLKTDMPAVLCVSITYIDNTDDSD